MPLSGIGLWLADSIDAEVGTELGGQVGDGRGRDHAERQHVDAGAGQAGDDGRFEELAGCPRVAADDRDRPAADGARLGKGAHAVQHARRRTARSRASSAVRSRLATPANTVRAEQPATGTPPVFRR